MQGSPEARAWVAAERLREYNQQAAAHKGGAQKAAGVKCNLTKRCGVGERSPTLLFVSLSNRFASFHFPERRDRSTGVDRLNKNEPVATTAFPVVRCSYLGVAAGALLRVNRGRRSSVQTIPCETCRLGAAVAREVKDRHPQSRSPKVNHTVSPSLILWLLMLCQCWSQTRMNTEDD